MYFQSFIAATAHLNFNENYTMGKNILNEIDARTILCDIYTRRDFTDAQISKQLLEFNDIAN